jgi:hypothetical protein
VRVGSENITIQQGKQRVIFAHSARAPQQKVQKVVRKRNAATKNERKKGGRKKKGKKRRRLKVCDKQVFSFSVLKGADNIILSTSGRNRDGKE